jgi:hypothetical protein
MAKKSFVREVELHVELHRCPRTGVAWVEDGRTGNGHSAHPNIAASGSVAGMISRGYWRSDDLTAKTHGFIYNLSRLVVSDDLDKLAAVECRCGACRIRKENQNG